MVNKGSRSAAQAGEVSSAISPAERSSEGECDPEKGGEEIRKEAKESSGITTAPSRKADDRDKDEEAVVEVIKKEEDQEEKETKGRDGSGREKAGWNHSKFKGTEGYLDLLLEAVRQVSGGLFDEEPGKEKALEEEKVSERTMVGVAQGSKRRGTEGRRSICAMIQPPSSDRSTGGARHCLRGFGTPSSTLGRSYRPSPGMAGWRDPETGR